jgi:hypothetical protein
MESQITPTPTPTPTPTVDPFVYGFGAVSLDGVTDECFGIRAKDKVLMYRHGVTGTWRSLEGICTSEPEIIKYSTTKMGVILKGSDNQPYKKVTTDGGKTWSTWKLWK